MVETLECRRLLSVTLGSPSASAWVYGQTESASAIVIDGITNAPPPINTEVDLVNAVVATAAPSPILVKGYTSDASGDVTFDLTKLNVGSYNLTAEFTDSGGNLEKSNNQAVAVSQASTTTTLASSADGQASVPFGQPVVFKATVQTVSPGSGMPGGLVLFKDTSTSPPKLLGQAAVAWNSKVTTPDTGVATFVYASLPPGTHTIVGFYQGNRDFAPSDNSASPDSVVVAKASTKTYISAAPNPANYGDAVTLSAAVVPSFLPPGPIPIVNASAGSIASTALLMPTGSVQFLDNDVNLGSPVPLVSGRAQLIASPATIIGALPVGTDAITAVYIPDPASMFQASKSLAYNEVILPSPPPPPIATTTTVAPPSQSILLGSEASFTISVIPTTGMGGIPGSDKVYMYDLSALMGPVSNATLAGNLLGVAAYDTAHSDWTFTTTTPLAGGFHTILAFFAGDATFAPSSGKANVTVAPQVSTQTKVSASPNPAVYGNAVALTATVVPVYFGAVTTAPTGSVQFAYTIHGTLTPSVLLGGPVPLVNGQAHLTVPSTSPPIAALPVGIDDITAIYIPAAGSTLRGSTSRAFSEVILPVPGAVPTTTTVTPPSQFISAGSQASFTIAVSTPAAGPVAISPTDPVYLFDLGASSNMSAPAIFLGAAKYDATNSDWTFTTTTPLPPGNHTIEAVFAGDSTYASSQGLATVFVALTPPPLGPASNTLSDPFAPAAVTSAT
jgi:hypothetical protein